MTAEMSPNVTTTALETKTFSVSALLEAIRKGRVRIPRFQRRFRWEDEDRRLLFDSIQAGFPIGTLLLAQGTAPGDRVALGGFSIDVPFLNNALWVVDGQQRLSTLAMALLEDHSGTYRPIFFDLQKDVFVLGSKRRSSPSHWLPTNVLGSSAALNRWLRDAALTEDLSDRADVIAGRIREYEVPAYVVPYDGTNDSVLIKIFARVNNQGRALKSTEVFQALHSSFTGDRGPIDRVGDDLSPLGFGDLNAKLVERAAMAVANIDPGGKLEGGLDDGAVAGVFARLSASLSRAIEFLTHDVGVPHIDWLPYSGVLATLAKIFDLHPSLHPHNRVLLARWFWRGTLSGAHRTDNKADRPRWQALDSDQNESVQRLLKLLPTVIEVPVPPLKTPFSQKSAQAKAELIALASLEPRVMLDGDEPQTTLGSQVGLPITLSKLIETDDTFPRPVDAPGERTVANYFLHPVFTFDALLAANPSDELLWSQALDREMLDAYRSTGLAGLVRRRTERVESLVKTFFVREAGLDPPDHDRQPLEAYFTDESK